MGRSNDYVRVEHEGIRRDDSSDGAVLFELESTDGDVTWVPRSLLKSYDDEELWIPEWKAEDLEVDYE